MTETSEHDHIAHRLVMALDGLPVPEEPTGFGAVAKPSLGRDPRMLLAAALLLALVTTLTSPQFQQAAAELTRYIERIVLGPAWVGYYHDHSGPQPSGPPALRLLVASGDAHGRPTTPDIVGAFAYHGPWSPDREQITVSIGSQLYVGDRSGRLRPIADVGLGYVVVPLGWIGNDKVRATVSPLPGGLDAAASTSSLVTVDLRTGSLERHTYENLPRWLGGPISPDGRWLTAFLVLPSPGEARCGFIPAVYDFMARQVVEIVDANGRSASAFGFLSDGRIVIGQCDRVARTLELYVGAPGARPSLIAVLPMTAREPRVALGSGADEILVIASGPEAPQHAYVFDPSGRLLRRTLLPQLALAGTLDFAGLSRDGRFLSFDVNALVRVPVVTYVQRAGVVDLTTGHVTYLCDSGCDYLFLR